MSPTAARTAAVLAAALAVSVAGGSPASAAPADGAAGLPAPAALVYQQHGFADNVIYVNNPEAVNSPRDTNDHAMHRQTVNPGYHRDFFEQSTTSHAITYGIHLQNTSECPLIVQVAGKGSTAGQDGGKPWATMLNAMGAGTGAEAEQNVPAKGSIWLFTMTVPKGKFFSGVVDFQTQVSDTCGGAAYVKHFAFANQGSPDTPGTLPSAQDAAALPYKGPVGAYSDARTYNGAFVSPGVPSVPVTDVVAQNLNYTVDDSTPAGAWNPTTGAVSNQFPVTYNGGTHTGWNTHVTPSRDPSDAVGSDMVSVMMPLDEKDPTVLSEVNPTKIDPRDADQPADKQRYPNLGNWGVIYTVTGTITNTGTKQHVVATGLTRTSKVSWLQLATRCHSGGASGPWEDQSIAPSDTNPVYCQVTVPPGQSRTYAMQVVVGGPSGTHLHNFQLLKS